MKTTEIEIVKYTSSYLSQASLALRHGFRTPQFMDELRELQGRFIRHIPVAHPAGSFAVQIVDPANLLCVFEIHARMTSGLRSTSEI